MKKSTSITALVVGSAVLASAGIIAGSAFAAVSADSKADGLYPINTNSSGLSYGSDSGLTPEQSPDLVLVIGDKGREGYVYARELNDAPPASPEEAVASQAKPGEVFKTLDVYLRDGVTKVDTFTIVGSPAGESK